MLFRHMFYQLNYRGVFGGSGEIRTHGTLRFVGFQDRRIKPLSHTSKLARRVGFEPTSFSVNSRARSPRVLSPNKLAPFYFRRYGLVVICWRIHVYICASTIWRSVGVTIPCYELDRLACFLYTNRPRITIFPYLLCRCQPQNILMLEQHLLTNLIHALL